MPGSVVFNSEQTEKTFTFTANQDTDDDDESVKPASVHCHRRDGETYAIVASQDLEDDDGESVKLTFGPLPTGVSDGANDEAVVSITDDDKPTSLTVNSEQSNYTVAKGGNATVKITLNDDPEMDVTIPITKANEDSASDSEYSGVPANVTFNSGDTEKEFTFTAVNDTLDDDGESVRLSFGTLPTVASAGATSESVVNITDDDPEVTVRFGQATYTVAESDDSSTTEVKENEVAVKVVLSADPERTVTVLLTHVPQDGATSADCAELPANVTFSPGETEQSFTFSAANATIDDDGKSVDLSFGTLPPRVSEASINKETTVNITDDDKPSSLTVNFGDAAYTVTEGNNVTIKVTLSDDPEMDVTLSDDPEMDVTIPIPTINQGGASNGDYSGVPNSVTLAPETRRRPSPSPQPATTWMTTTKASS